MRLHVLYQKYDVPIHPNLIFIWFFLVLLLVVLDVFSDFMKSSFCIMWSFQLLCWLSW